MKNTKEAVFMLDCKGCECIIVPGRAFLTSGGYYCPHCMERMSRGTCCDVTMKTKEERGHFDESL